MVTNQRRQANALNQARKYGLRGDAIRFANFVKRANRYHPINEMQWWRLEARFGIDVIEQIKKEIEQENKRFHGPESGMRTGRVTQAAKK